MTNLRNTLFISDLHLEESTPEITHQFLQLLNNCVADTLYIQGDLFETWIGDDDNSLFHQAIMQTLFNATKKGLKIFIMHGNRDFLLGKKFMQRTGCQLLPEEFVADIYGTPVLLMHGDTLCTRDIQYLKARKLAFNPVIQKLFLFLPLSLRRRIANKLRGKSETHKHTTAMDIMDVTQDAVEQMMRKHHVQYLIHGHTHRPAIHEFKLGGENVYRIVLPAWHGHGSVLIWDSEGKRKMVDLKTEAA